MPVFAAIVSETEPTALPQIETVIINILRVATSLVGLAVLAMFILGAFQLLTAGSNQENAQKARQTFTFAFIGAAALILVWFLFLFIKEFTGVDVFKFRICIPGGVSGDFCGL